VGAVAIASVAALTGSHLHPLVAAAETAAAPAARLPDREVGNLSRVFLPFWPGERGPDERTMHGTVLDGPFDCGIVHDGILFGRRFVV
jgi:hypothetical protein